MTRQQSPELPEHKPLAEMTREERLEYARELGRITRRELAELNRPKRERQLRRGLVRPRNRAEMEIFAADLLKDKPNQAGPGRRKSAGLIRA
jgi:hypothetical protein